eukprot:9404-Heterococcus_DN1.PRE.2
MRKQAYTAAIAHCVQLVVYTHCATAQLTRCVYCLHCTLPTLDNNSVVHPASAICLTQPTLSTFQAERQRLPTVILKTLLYDIYFPDPFEVLEKQRLRLATVTEEDLITSAAIHLKDSACQGLLVWLKYTPDTIAYASLLLAAAQLPPTASAIITAATTTVRTPLQSLLRAYIQHTATSTQPTVPEPLTSAVFTCVLELAENLNGLESEQLLTVLRTAAALAFESNSSSSSTSSSTYYDNASTSSSSSSAGVNGIWSQAFPTVSKPLNRAWGGRILPPSQIPPVKVHKGVAQYMERAVEAVTNRQLQSSDLQFSAALSDTASANTAAAGTSLSRMTSAGIFEHDLKAAGLQFTVTSLSTWRSPTPPPLPSVTNSYSTTDSFSSSLLFGAGRTTTTSSSSNNSSSKQQQSLSVPPQRPAKELGAVRWGGALQGDTLGDYEAEVGGVSPVGVAASALCDLYALQCVHALADVQGACSGALNVLLPVAIATADDSADTKNSMTTTSSSSSGATTAGSSSAVTAIVNSSNTAGGIGSNGLSSGLNGDSKSSDVAATSAPAQAQAPQPSTANFTYLLTAPVLPLTLYDVLRATRQPPSSKARPNSEPALGITPIPLAAPLLRHLLRGLLQGVADIHAAGYALRMIDTNCVYLSASGNVRIGGLGGAVRVPATPLSVTAAGISTSTTATAAATAATGSGSGSVHQTSTVLGVMPPPLPPTSFPLTPNGSSGIGSSAAAAAAALKEPHKRALPLLAPELLLGSNEFTQASDTWAVGCIAVQLAVGKPLFTGKDRKQQCGHIFKACGTPGKDNWPSGALLPLYNDVKLVDPAGNTLNCKYVDTICYK